MRKLKRFFHPTDIIAKELSEKYAIKFKKTLKRIRNTDFQWKMSKQNRFKNVKGAFLSICDVSGLKILLVDDIMTTGATINECALVLKNNGAEKVDCFVFSRGLIK
jgi:ComF family protein